MKLNMNITNRSITDFPTFHCDVKRNKKKRETEEALKRVHQIIKIVLFYN